MELILRRFAYTPQGVFGRLDIPDAPDWECFTVERPWDDNKPNVSCIPLGTYPVSVGYYARGGYPAYELHDVPGRSLIKIHRANHMDELMGCIAPGTALGTVGGRWAVISSRLALHRLMEGGPYSHITIADRLIGAKRSGDYARPNRSILRPGGGPNWTR